MEQDKLLMLVATHAGMDDARLLVASVRGEVNHRTVRVEVFEGVEPGDYRYAVTVRDEETREFLGTGNPAPNPEEALENVHWPTARSGGLQTSEDW